MININEINIRDPFILKERKDYYLYSSKDIDGKHCFICYKSNNLIDFSSPKIIFEENSSFWGDQDFWAPEVHKYKSRYYLFASFKSKYRPRGTSILVCNTPDGTFVPLKNGPVTPDNWECLDGTLFVDNNKPYMIFCREWLEVKDGEIYCVELSDDLQEMKGKPYLLFKASEAPWVKPLVGNDNFVTDGPFLFKKDGEYYMTWSSFSKNGYAVGIAKSSKIFSHWTNEEKPIYDENGGHAMLFEDGNKKVFMALHSPNDRRGQERLKIVNFESIFNY